MIAPGASRLMIALAALVVLAPVTALAQGAGLGAAGELVDPEVLRVCADPSNMPSSDESGDGFENRLAELVAEKTGRKSVAYTWFPMVMGFVRQTLSANRCDIIMGYAQGDQLVQNTNAYYRSTYLLIFPRGKGLDGLETLEDERLLGKKIGVVQATPPTSNMAAAKLMRTAKIYPLMVNTKLVPPVAETMIADLVKGETDAIVAWGPVAGYFVKKSGADLVSVPLLKEKTGARMSYRITMGVRPSDQEWKRTLNRFIKDNQDAINTLLIEYNVPLFDEQDRPITN